MKIGAFITGLLLSFTGLAGPDPGASNTTTYSVATDGLSLIVKLPTHSDPNKPIIARIEMRNDRDRQVSYLSSVGGFPFALEVRDDAGEWIATVGEYIDPEELPLAAHEGIRSDFDFAKFVHTSGHYHLTVKSYYDAVPSR